MNPKKNLPPFQVLYFNVFDLNIVFNISIFINHFWNENNLAFFRLLHPQRQRSLRLLHSKNKLINTPRDTI